MKKLYFILGLMMAGSASAYVYCEDAGGVKITGQDGTTEYCLGPQKMNWWSANAWCQEVGGSLFDLRDCQKVSNHNTVCPQLLGKLEQSFYYWTNAVSETIAITFYCASSDPYAIYRHEKNKTPAKPLCRLN